MTSTTSSAARRCVAVLAALCFTACAESHVGDEADAAALDAAVAPDAPASLPDAFVAPPDAPPIDAFVCPDSDGDGFADTGCGGEDCDDADPALSPERGPCASPTSAIRCRDGATQEVACPAETPECNASTDECVPSGEACGDAVVHPSEQCDDGNDDEADRCLAGCLFGYCRDHRDCEAPAPYCTQADPDGRRRCARGHPGGLADGSRCLADDECASGLCDPEQLRCTQFCSSGDSEACPGATRWCSFTASEIGSAGIPVWPFRCVDECGSSAECGSGAACSIHAFFTPTERYVVAACRLVRLGTDRVAGDACPPGGACATNLCLDGVCTTVCRTDSDCPPALPVCADYDWPSFLHEPEPRPIDVWGTEYPRICTTSDAP